MLFYSKSFLSLLFLFLPGSLYAWPVTPETKCEDVCEKDNFFSVRIYFKHEYDIYRADTLKGNGITLGKFNSIRNEGVGFDWDPIALRECIYKCNKLVRYEREQCEVFIHDSNKTRGPSSAFINDTKLFKGIDKISEGTANRPPPLKGIPSKSTK